MVRIAALTMSWNEAYFLPLWLRHYAGQLGAENCFVIDHGSDDGSTDSLDGASRIRMPRTPLDETRRAACVSDVAAGLLAYYDVVFHTDVDELLVADPLVASGLAEFCARCDLPVVTAIGLDVNHAPRTEPEIDPQRLVSLQRGWVRFVSPMCKPAMIRRPVRWQPGFHSADAEIRFDRLFNFHLRRHDLQHGLRRLAKTRAMARAHSGVNEHQAIGDEQFTNDFLYGVGHLPSRTDVSLDPGEAPLRDWLQRIEGEQHARAGEFYRLDLGLVAEEFWAIPERFAGTF